MTVMTRQQAEILSAASDRWTLVIRRFPSSHSRWLEMLFCVRHLLEHGIKVARVKDVIPACTSVLLKYYRMLWIQATTKCHMQFFILDYSFIQKYLENIKLWIIISWRGGDFLSYYYVLFQLPLFNLFFKISINIRNAIKLLNQ